MASSSPTAKLTTSLCGSPTPGPSAETSTSDCLGPVQPSHPGITGCWPLSWRGREAGLSTQERWRHGQEELRMSFHKECPPKHWSRPSKLSPTTRSRAHPIPRGNSSLLGASCCVGRDSGRGVGGREGGKFNPPLGTSISLALMKRILPFPRMAECLHCSQQESWAGVGEKGRRNYI